MAPGRPPLALARCTNLLFCIAPAFVYAVAVMSPHVKPQSSRATAVAATCDFFPRLTRRVYLLNSRVWAFRTYSINSGGCPCRSRVA